MVTAASLLAACSLLDPETRMPKPEGYVRVLREFGEVQSDNGVLYLMERKGNYKALPVFKPEQVNMEGCRGSKVRGCGVQGNIITAVEHHIASRRPAISPSLEWQPMMASQHVIVPPNIWSRAAARPPMPTWTPSQIHMADENNSSYVYSGKNVDSDSDSDTDSEYGDINMEQSSQRKPRSKQRHNHVLEIMLLDDASDDEEHGSSRINLRQHGNVELTTTAAPNVTQAQQQTSASQEAPTTHEGTEVAKPKKKFRKLRKACSAMRRACIAAVTAAFAPRNCVTDKKNK